MKQYSILLHEKVLNNLFQFFCQRGASLEAIYHRPGDCMCYRLDRTPFDHALDHGQLSCAAGFLIMWADIKNCPEVLYKAARTGHPNFFRDTYLSWPSL